MACTKATTVLQMYMLNKTLQNICLSSQDTIVSKKIAGAQ